MSKTKLILRAATSLALLALVLFLGFYLGQRNTQRAMKDTLSQFMRAQMESTAKDKMSQTMSMIDQFYIDSIGLDTLVEAFMPQLIDKLDPHSEYIPSSELSRVNESLDGEFDGIGIVFNMATDTVIVLNVIAGGPSSKVGLMARDRIIQINDSLVAGIKMPQDSIVSRLRGKRDTKVRIGVERDGNPELLEFEIVRGKIPIHSVTSAFVLQDSVGYIRLEQFSRSTYKEFIGAVNEVYKQGAKKLILDLRGNPGGYMDQAILMATEFLDKGKLIVYTEDRAGRQLKEYADHEGQLQDIPLAVLIDEGSASSSEIVAGALQDNDRGLIIGRRSFGKGLIQRQIPLEDGSALRLTTARYFTPTGRSIQKNYSYGDQKGYDREILDRFEHEEFFTADSISFADSLKFKTPGGRIVYGGGGIMPDYFVPLSKDSLPKFFLEASKKNLIYKFTIKYSDKNRLALGEVKTIDDLNAFFASRPELYDDFVEYTKSEKLQSTPKEVEEARELIEQRLRAFLGRNTDLEDDGFYSQIYSGDDIIMRALESLAETPLPTQNN